MIVRLMDHFCVDVHVRVPLTDRYVPTALAFELVLVLDVLEIALNLHGYNETLTFLSNSFSRSDDLQRFPKFTKATSYLVK